MKKQLKYAVKLYNSKRFNQALKELQELKEDPKLSLEDSREVMYYQGLAYTQLKLYDDALLHLEQVVTNHESLLHVLQSRMILGYIYIVTNRFKLAEYEFNQLLKEGAESIQIYALLGYLAYSQKNVEKSIEFLKLALELDANYPNALNSLGYIYADQNINPLEAIILCKKAVHQKPNNPAYLDSLGWAYYKNNQSAEARTYVRKALDFAPGNKEIVKHMKIILDSLG